MFKVKLRAIRESQNISQLELSRLTRIAPSGLSAVESGKLYCYPGWRKRISEALKVSEKEIFPEEADNHASSAAG